MKKVVVIQARSGSSRLPGKALLQFRGLPMIVLAARRAASTGRNVLLATSDCPSDDALAEVAASNGIACYRGSRDDVLGRFTRALENFPDNTIVTRLTGDNIVPDGNLIDEVEEEFLGRDLDYISTTDRRSGLPYGVSVEMTRLAHLREAGARAESDTDREHVTPYIIRKFGHTPFLRYRHLSKSCYRATVDCFDDFTSLHRIFPESADPMEVAWQELVERSPLGLYQPGGDEPIDDFVLGTAQLGMPYGITNCSVLTDAESSEMIKTAIGNGVHCLDTARAYGRSEDVIGRTLSPGWAGRCEVVTKLSPFAERAEEMSECEVRAEVKNSVLESCLSLQQRRIDTLLLHRASHLTAFGGAVWRQLRDLQAENRIGTLGVSVQAPQELITALRHREVGHIQLPYNILDKRWRSVLSGLADVRMDRSIVVHVRSALLQGLLPTDKPEAWSRAHVADPAPIRLWLENLVSDLGREDVADLCFAWVRSQDWVDGVVVGSDNLLQLELNLTQFRNAVLSSTDIEQIEATRPSVGDETLDPSRWVTGGNP